VREKTVLVTGGGGYIGSHFVKLLMQKGYTPVVIDNFENGHRDSVLCPDWYEGELEDRALLDRVFRAHNIGAVVHFAAYMYVAESMTNPRKYWERNVGGLLAVSGAAMDHDVRKFLYSSSCSVYGAPLQQPITESTAKAPINPYGWTKYIGEHVLESYRRSHGLAPVMLRYFNVSGADPDLELGERHKLEIHAVPVMLQAARDGAVFNVFGNDYATPDGTCIRDYIHVWDLARAHLCALEYLDHPGDAYAFNLGTGRGASVLELAAAVEAATGKKVQLNFQPRRDGDPPMLVADASLARRVLGWAPEYADITSVVASAWRFMSTGRGCGT